MVYHFLKDEYDSVLYYSRPTSISFLKSIAYARTANQTKQKKLRIHWKNHHRMITHFKSVFSMHG